MAGIFLECGAERIGVWNILRDTVKPLQSANKNSANDRFRMVSHRECFFAKWFLPRPTRRRGCCESSSAEVVCHAGSGASPFGTLIRNSVLNTGVGAYVSSSESNLSTHSGTG